MDKKYNGKVLFNQKKFLLNFGDFLVFSNSAVARQNLRLVHNLSEFSCFFDTYVDPGSAMI